MAKEQEVDQVIGRQVREARKRLRVQQTELARRLAESGVSMHQATVARLERGERVATVGDIFDVAATLGVSPLWLLSGSYTDEPVPVLDRAYGPGQMRFWLRAEAALPGTSEENFATVV